MVDDDVPDVQKGSRDSGPGSAVLSKGAAAATGGAVADVAAAAAPPKQQQPEKGRTSDMLSEDFMLYVFKISPCPRSSPHPWRECSFAHKGENARRRHPSKYRSVACPASKAGQPCKMGDECPFAHSTNEFFLHPARFRTQMCTAGASCTRPICYFAHTTAELRPVTHESLSTAQREMLFASRNATVPPAEAVLLEATIRASVIGELPPIPAGALDGNSDGSLGAVAALSLPQPQQVPRMAVPCGAFVAGGQGQLVAARGGGRLSAPAPPALLLPVQAAPAVAPSGWVLTKSQPPMAAPPGLEYYKQQHIVCQPTTSVRLPGQQMLWPQLPACTAAVSGKQDEASQQLRMQLRAAEARLAQLTVEARVAAAAEADAEAAAAAAMAAVAMTRLQQASGSAGSTAVAGMGVGPAGLVGQLPPCTVVAQPGVASSMAATTVLGQQPLQVPQPVAMLLDPTAVSLDLPPHVFASSPSMGPPVMSTTFFM